MLNEKATLRRYILALDFAIDELILFLDSHPDNQKALQLLEAYRARKRENVAEYEKKFGELVITADEVRPSGSWKWIKGPWPWENNFLEEQ